MKDPTRCGQTVHPREMDELLELIWTQREQGKDGEPDILALSPVESAERWLKALVEEKLVVLTDRRVKMTLAGEKEAEQIIRRHRLTERLFADVFQTSEEVWEREACELEHTTVLTDEAVSAICAFLGHPPTCPHGRPIPRGECCEKLVKEIKPHVVPLTETELAYPYRIVFITAQGSMRLDRLAVLGLLPGSIIQIHQKRPSYVIRIGETDVALDRETARDIYVKRTSL